MASFRGQPALVLAVRYRQRKLGGKEGPRRARFPIVRPKVVGSTTTYHWRSAMTGYDAYGDQTSSIDGRGVNVPDTTTSATAPSISPNGQAATYTSQWTYTTAGDVHTSVTPPTTTTLNGNTNTAPVTPTFGYDGDGNQTSVLDGNGNTTATSYDHLGRVTSTTLPQVTLYTGGNATPTSAVTHDGDGNAVSTTDGAGGTSTASYDPLGRIVSSANQIGETTIFTYTATEDAATRDPQGNVTTYGTYDAAGRLGQVTDGSSRTQQFTYDNAGIVTGVTTGSSGSPVQTETRTYDALNELATDTVSGPSTSAQTTTLSYDLHGNLVRQDHANGDVTFTSYDLAGDATSSERDPNNATLPTHSSQECVSQDQAANTTSGTDWDSQSTQLTIDGAERLTAGTNSYGSTISTSFDPNGNVLKLSETAGTTNSTDSFGYNAANWATSSTDGTLSTSYGYDGAARLRTFSIAAPAGTVSITLNAAGLSTAISDGTYATGITRNGNDLPAQISLPGSVAQHGQYDGASRTTYVDAIGPTGVNTPAGPVEVTTDATKGVSQIGNELSLAGSNGNVIIYDEGKLMSNKAFGNLYAEYGGHVLLAQSESQLIQAEYYRRSMLGLSNKPGSCVTGP